MKLEHWNYMNNEIIFKIGKSASENTCIIKDAEQDDIWFHAQHDSSCHVVTKLPENITKKEKQTILKRGALLCKQHTNKLKSLQNVVVIYTSIKNITPTKIPGEVKIAGNTKSVVI